MSVGFDGKSAEGNRGSGGGEVRMIDVEDVGSLLDVRIRGVDVVEKTVELTASVVAIRVVDTVEQLSRGCM